MKLSTLLTDFCCPPALWTSDEGCQPLQKHARAIRAQSGERVLPAIMPPDSRARREGRMASPARPAGFRGDVGHCLPGETWPDSRAHGSQEERLTAGNSAR